MGKGSTLRENGKEVSVHTRGFNAKRLVAILGLKE